MRTFTLLSKNRARQIPSVLPEYRHRRYRRFRYREPWERIWQHQIPDKTQKELLWYRREFSGQG